MTKVTPPESFEPGIKARGLGRIVIATGYSLAGLRAAFTHEASFRQEVMIGAVMAPLAFVIGRGPVEISLLLGSLVIVLIVELINSAIETLVDRVGTEPNELSGRAKDIGSAAVMLSLGLVVIVWGLILFMPRG